MVIVGMQWQFGVSLFGKYVRAPVGYVLQSHLRNYIVNGLVTFLFFDLILSFQTSNCEEILYENSLTSCPSHFHNICLPHGKPYAIKPNFILDSSFPCYAWLCCHIHAHSSCLCFSSILPPLCSCSMFLYFDMPFSDSINRFGTNMYIPYDSI